MLVRCLPRYSRHTHFHTLSRAARVQLQEDEPSPGALIDVSRLSHLALEGLADLPSDSFVVYPGLLSLQEQFVLLRSSLAKLGGRRRRRKRPYELGSSQGSYAEQQLALSGLFGRDDDYHFEEVSFWRPALVCLDDNYRRVKGHFDGVIRDYREMTVSAWPDSSHSDLASILLRLYKLVDPNNAPSDPGLLTPPNIQTHILHLASTGVILPHVDNVEASGGMIAGVSLGDTRVLRLSQGTDVVDVLLESGSVYIQRCVIVLLANI